ncbi:hypothetical protein [Heyndrickxia sporothermodurans]|uniref:hypothetical protein n=1 Tax=Heyndrickxia sporothermodurans TaxID=46224 RepID=UPI000D3704AD|nr:hypothetical protein [Heyndrickxia sporothermodurans]PTY93041.1 hypothetical protein B5V90_02860 [Heyndrickxia sporothermodurans]
MSLPQIPENDALLLKLLKRRCKELEDGVRKFVDKNYTGGSKSDREDYAQMVSAKDIYDLRELIREK